MKKFVKTTLLLLTAAMFLAGCKNNAPEETGPSANIETDAVNLSDGLWFMDSDTTQTISYAGQSQTSKTQSHMEMEISGNDIEIIKATYTADGVTKDVTADMKEAYKTARDAETPDTTAPSSGLPITIDEDAISTETKIYKNEDETEFRITVAVSFKLSDLFGEGLTPEEKAELSALGDMAMDSYSEVNYKKQ